MIGIELPERFIEKTSRECRLKKLGKVILDSKDASLNADSAETFSYHVIAKTEETDLVEFFYKGLMVHSDEIDEGRLARRKASPHKGLNEVTEAAKLKIISLI